MFINPFEFEMYKYLDVPLRADDAQKPVAASSTWRKWFGRRERPGSVTVSAERVEKN